MTLSAGLNSSNSRKVGLEAISFDVPEHFLNLEDLARARGVDPGKFLLGLGQKQMAVPTPCEDSVTLATGAGLKLLKDFNIDPSSIGLLVVGTETSIDHSKPVSSYVHEFLGLDESCRVYETKHACYGAMAGVGNAVNWILSGRARGKKALVIASDIAYYGLKTPGEPTQGGGSVAMLISDQPHLLEVDPSNEGYYSKQVMDFWRPLYSKEAFADGHYSIQCYLDALAGAYGSYRKSYAQNSTIGMERDFSRRYSACLYHAPFAKMSQKAHFRLLETDAERSFEKDTPEFAAAQEDFKKRVAPWLDISARVGNLYTGSVFLSLYSYLQNKTAAAPGQQISLFSYGSGCVAEFVGATVGSEIHRIQKLTPYQEVLDKRQQLSVPEYESMISAYSKTDLNGFDGCDPSRWNLKRSLVYVGNREHRRQYEFLNKT